MDTYEEYFEQEKHEIAFLYPGLYLIHMDLFKVVYDDHLVSE